MGKVKGFKEYDVDVPDSKTESHQVKIVAKNLKCIAVFDNKN